MTDDKINKISLEQIVDVGCKVIEQNPDMNSHASGLAMAFSLVFTEYLNKNLEEKRDCQQQKLKDIKRRLYKYYEKSLK